MEGALNRMMELGDEVYDLCGCALMRTHVLPCACSLRMMYDAGMDVEDVHIHRFWCSLRVGPAGEDEGTEDGVGPDMPDKDFFERMMDVAQGLNDVQKRAVASYIYKLQNPCNVEERGPAVTKKGRGRPKGSKSTKRDKSKFEYTAQRASQRSKGSSRGVAPMSVSDMGSRQKDVVSGHELEKYVLQLIRAHVTELLNVEADGNCGFRVMAYAMFGSQDRWRDARAAIAEEYSQNPEVYVVGSTLTDSLDATLERVRWDEPGICPTEHWMVSPDDLFPLANLLNAAIFMFANGRGPRDYQFCCTVLPTRADVGVCRPSREIAFGHCGSAFQHFFWIAVDSDCPIPPLMPAWSVVRKARVTRWPELYRDRFEAWAGGA